MWLFGSAWPGNESTVSTYSTDSTDEELTRSLCLGCQIPRLLDSPSQFLRLLLALHSIQPLQWESIPPTVSAHLHSWPFLRSGLNIAWPQSFRQGLLLSPMLSTEAQGLDGSRMSSLQPSHDSFSLSPLSESVSSAIPSSSHSPSPGSLALPFLPNFCGPWWINSFIWQGLLQSRLAWNLL